jgi:hypothetical protein
VLQFGRKHRFACRVDPLTDQDEGAVLPQDNGAGPGGEHAFGPVRDRRRAPCGTARQRGQCADVRRRRAAAPPQRLDPKVDEALHLVGEPIRRQREDCSARFENWQAGVGLDQKRSPCPRQEAPDRFEHVHGACAAVRADQLDAHVLHRVQKRQRRGSGKTQAGIEGHADPDREPADVAGSNDDCLGFRKVVVGFREQEIDPALDQPLDLLFEDADQFAEWQIAQRLDHAAARPDAPGHPAPGAGLRSGQSGHDPVEGPDVDARPELERRAPEGVRRQDHGPRVAVLPVDPADHLRAGEPEELRVLPGRQPPFLEQCAHAPVEDEETVVSERIPKIVHLLFLSRMPAAQRRAGITESNRNTEIH